MSFLNTRLISSVSLYRYELIGSLLIVLSFKFILNGQWAGDFYEHAAVVKELSANPINPRNPIIGTNTPHAFISPYSLSLGIFSKLFQIDAVNTLSIAAIVNLILLLFSLKYFISTFYNQDQRKISFFALIFLLFLWGKNPWWYSGFLHMDVLFYVLPYPSTFSFATGFFAVAAFINFSKNNKILLGILAIVSLSIGLISHPVTMLSFFIIIFFLSIDNGFFSKSTLLGLLVTALSLVLALLWPYYSLLQLIENDSGIADFNSDTRDLYQNIVPILLPLILLFPIIFLKHFNQNRPLILSLFTTLIIYLAGYCFEFWGFGRIISSSAVILQIILASRAAVLEDTLLNRKALIPSFLFSLFIVILLCRKFYYPVVNALQIKKPVYSKFKFLSHHTQQYDVILSDLETSFYVPSFGGKAIASPHPLHFIPDHRERRNIIELFFDCTSSTKERQKILDLYSVKFILLDHRKEMIMKEERDLKAFGRVIYNDLNYTLIKIY